MKSNLFTNKGESFEVELELSDASGPLALSAFDKFNLRTPHEVIAGTISNGNRVKFTKAAGFDENVRYVIDHYDLTNSKTVWIMHGVIVVTAWL